MITLGLRGMRWQAHPLLNSAEYAEEAHNVYRRHFGLVPLRRGERSPRLPTTDMTPFRTLYLHDDVLMGTFDERDFVSSPVIGDTANRVYFIEGDSLQYLPKHQINAGYPTDLTTLGHSTALPRILNFSEFVNGGSTQLTYGMDVIGGIETIDPNLVTVDSLELYQESTFVYTFVDRYGGESPPSYPSQSKFFLSNETEIELRMHHDQQNPDIVGVRVYASINGEFFQVGSPLTSVPADPAQFSPTVPRLNFLLDMSAPIAAGTRVNFNYTFTFSPETLLDPLITTDWAAPPTGVKHLLALDNGMVVMADDHNLYFNEPYHMHAWPSAYDREVEGTIIAMEKTAAGFVVITNREAHFFMGNTPEGMQETRQVFRYPVFDKRSVTIMDDGVIYFCNEGIALVTSSHGHIITDQWIDREAFRDNVDVTEVKCEMYEGRIVVATRNPQNGNPIGYIFNMAERDITSFDLTEDAMQLGFWRDPETNDICYSDDLAGLAIFNRGDRLPFQYETGDIVVPRAANLCVAYVDAEEYPLEPDHIKLTTIPEGKTPHTVQVRGHRPTRLRSTGRSRKLRVRLESGKTITRVMLAMDARQA